MPKKVGQLNQTVAITKGFPGQYKWGGGASYYLNGDSTQGAIHFSVSGKNDEEFKSFHITPDVLSGTNVGIWFNPPNWTPSPNLNNLPSAKKSAWEDWWTNNQQNVMAAARLLDRGAKVTVQAVQIMQIRAFTILFQQRLLCSVRPRVFLISLAAACQRMRKAVL